MNRPLFNRGVEEGDQRAPRVFRLADLRRIELVSFWGSISPQRAEPRGNQKENHPFWGSSLNNTCPFLVLGFGLQHLQMCHCVHSACGQVEHLRLIHCMRLRHAKLCRFV